MYICLLIWLQLLSVKQCISHSCNLHFRILLQILDDDHGGIFAFSSKDHEICESVGVYELKVQRYSGARGKVRIPFSTEDGTAKAGKDYEMFHGELEFDNNESE